MGFIINRVYTRSGDSGQTSLLGSKRVSKSDIHIEVIGNLDELNSCLGLFKESLPEKIKLDFSDTIEVFQQVVFNIGAEVAAHGDSKKLDSVKESEVSDLEKLCDRLGEDLPELKSFILPGGSMPSSFAHLARSVARRTERSIVKLTEQSVGQYQLNPLILKYINRLSDVLFNFSRYVLHIEGIEPPLWKK